MTLDAYGEWCVRSNLKRIMQEGLDPADVVKTLRANGYNDVADAVEARGTKARLEYFRSQIRLECISMLELAQLQSLAKEIEPGDLELLEWAGVSEFAATASHQERLTRAIGSLRALSAYYDQKDTEDDKETAEDLDYAADILAGEIPLNKLKGATR